MRTASALIGGAVAVAVALIPARAGAAPSDDTIVTFNVVAGSLDLIAPPGPVNLGSAAPGGTLTGPIGPVSVTDMRGGPDGSWVVQVTSTDFIAGGFTIPATEIDYWSGPATATTGNGTFTPGQNAAGNAAALGAVSPLTAFTHTGGTGGNTAAWNPTLVINIPIGSEVGSYTATVTHSVA